MRIFVNEFFFGDPPNQILIFLPKLTEEIFFDNMVLQENECGWGSGKIEKKYFISYVPVKKASLEKKN